MIPFRIRLERESLRMSLLSALMMLSAIPNSFHLPRGANVNILFIVFPSPLCYHLEGEKTMKKVLASSCGVLAGPLMPALILLLKEIDFPSLNHHA